MSACSAPFVRNAVCGSPRFVYATLHATSSVSSCCTCVCVCVVRLGSSSSRSSSGSSSSHGPRSLKRPRPAENNPLRQTRRGDDRKESREPAMNVSTQAAAAAPASEISQQPRRPHRQQHQQHRPQQDSRGTGGGIGGHDLSLPWLADRFYLNVMPAVRESERNGQGEDWKVSQDANVKAESNRSGSNYCGASDSVGRGYANGPFFSLERLVDVVGGNGGPGIEAAIFGTMSLQIGYVSSRFGDRRTAPHTGTAWCGTCTIFNRPPFLRTVKALCASSWPSRTHVPRVDCAGIASILCAKSCVEGMCMCPFRLKLKAPRSRCARN